MEKTATKIIEIENANGSAAGAEYCNEHVWAEWVFGLYL